MRTWILMIVISLSINARVLARSTADYAVQVSAEVREDPPQLLFSWPPSPAQQYYVYKKAESDTSWGLPMVILDGGATQFVDMDIDIGEAYEYGIYRNLSIHFDTVTVPGGANLTFRIYDSWGDGICCGHGIGSYTVSACGSTYVSGGEFAGSESTSFVLSDTTSPGIEVVISIMLDAFPPETTWELLDNSSGQTLASGGPYESVRFGHIFAGIRYDPAEHRGTVLLLIDNTYSDILSSELNRLIVDLVCDGWRVKRHDIDRSEPVVDIKATIASECQYDQSITALFLFGHIPVPYSGNVMSAHSNHCRAWPADVYYGELDAEWTDDTVYNVSASRPANHNVPGDGKFDQTIIPSDIDLQVGRVDLYDLPAFSDSDSELLRRYLNKNHDYRSGLLTAQPRALIDDNVGVADGLAFAANGWRNFAVMFGSSNVHSRDYFSTLGVESYLWSYGCGGGSYTSCAGVGTTSDFASRTVQCVFTMLYGSYFGDWDNQNNILRAPLASENSILTCSWTGRPQWHLHHMALGENIGYSARLSQNNISLYTVSDGGRLIHTALMGDPTLKILVVRPASNLQLAVEDTSQIELSWTPSDDPGVESYHIYRSATLAGVFTRINAQPVTDTSYVDSSPLHGANLYMIRARKLETTGSGTYYNLSQGILDSTSALSTTNNTHPSTFSSYRLLQNDPNPFTSSTRIEYQIPRNGTGVELNVYNMNGQLIKTLVDEVQTKDQYGIVWDATDAGGRTVPGGSYLYRLVTDEYVNTKRMIFLR